jgi:hypothetical protein
VVHGDGETIRDEEEPRGCHPIILVWQVSVPPLFSHSGVAAAAWSSRLLPPVETDNTEMDGPVTQGNVGPAMEDLVLGRHGNAEHTSSNSERPTRRATHVSLVGHRPHDGPSADTMMPAGVDTQPDRLVISLRDQLQRRLHGTRSAVGACFSSRLDPLTPPGVPTTMRMLHRSRCVARALDPQNGQRSGELRIQNQCPGGDQPLALGLPNT